MRTASVNRKTKETTITVELTIDGSRKTDISTGIGFFDHMLTLFAFHAGFDLTVTCKGDLQVDCHHTVEDVGLAVGQALYKALGDKSDINRFGSSYVPMDESLSRAIVDISGRQCLVFQAEFSSERAGDFETEAVKEFFEALVRESKITMHVSLLYGDNTHHVIESIFKAVGRAIANACKITVSGIPSTKGVL